MPPPPSPPATPDASSEHALEILRRVRRMEIRTTRLADDTMAGRYASVFKGRGMDFDRVRNYVAGDDVRAIDWNVTARTGDPYIKLFTEERELTILLLIDISGSSDFGSTLDSKRELSAEAAGVLAASAIRNRDKVGLVLFTDTVELYIPPAKGRTHILRIIREALYFQPSRRGTNIPAALDFANSVISRRAIVFLVSDFQTPAPVDTTLALLRKKLSITNKHHDVIAVSITDPREQEIPNVGRLLIEDAETGEVVRINTANPKVRDTYREKSLARRTRTANLIRSAGVDLLEFTTGTDWLPALVNFFRTRRHRIG